MILITRTEADYMRSKGFGGLISISSKSHKSKHHRYYLTENQRALGKLNKYRESVKISSGV